MSAEKKSVKATKKAIRPDVERPGKSAPTITSRPIIVTNRPILKDPMVAGGDSDAQETGQDDLAHAVGPKLQPVEEKPPEPEAKQLPEESLPLPEKEEAPAEEAAATVTEPNKKDGQEKEAAAQAEQIKHDAAVQELIESRRYRLPINAVEKRKAKHFVILGILLAILLALAWADIALDAGLIHIDGVKPITHFFSN